MLILLLVIIIIRYHYAKQKGIIQMENNEFKKVCIKNHTCYYLDDIIKLEDFDHDKILKDEISYENIFIYKALLIQNLCVFKIDGFIRIYNGTRYLTLLGSEKYDAI